MSNPVTATFPLAAPADADLTVASEDAFTTLTASISANDDIMPVASTVGFDVPCILAVENELILALNAPLSNQFSGCIRGFGGSIASTHTNNLEVDALYTAYHHNKTAAEIKAIGAWLFQNDLMGLRNNENRLPWSEAFDRVEWQKVNGGTIVQTNVASPDGGTNARLVQDGTTVGFQGLSTTPWNLSAGTSYVWSIYAKAGSGTPLVVMGQDVQNENTRCAWFDLNAGTVLTVGSAARAAIVSVGGGGWYRLIVVTISTSLSTINFEIGFAPSNGVVSYTPSASRQVVLWGALVTTGNLSAPLPYVKTQGAITSGVVPALPADEGDLL